MLGQSIEEHGCRLEERIAADLRLSNVHLVVLIYLSESLIRDELLYLMEGHLNVVVRRILPNNHFLK